MLYIPCTGVLRTLVKKIVGCRAKPSRVRCSCEGGHKWRRHVVETGSSHTKNVDRKNVDGLSHGYIDDIICFRLCPPPGLVSVNQPKLETQPESWPEQSGSDFCPKGIEV
jgi:hypothetical protein